MYIISKLQTLIAAAELEAAGATTDTDRTYYQGMAAAYTVMLTHEQDKQEIAAKYAAQSLPINRNPARTAA